MTPIIQAGATITESFARKCALGSEVAPRPKPQLGVLEGKLQKETVITIHGVNPDRQWQARVGRVLSPHFDCVPFTYYGYDTIFGPLRAVANIATFVTALSLGAAAVFECFEINWIIAIIFAALCN